MASFKMQARASDTGVMWYWTAANRDFAGGGYPGTGTPEDVAVTGINGDEEETGSGDREIVYNSDALVVVTQQQSTETVICDNAAPVIDVRKDSQQAITVGSVFYFSDGSTNGLTVTPGNGVTINRPGGGSGSIPIRAKGTLALLKISGNEWILTGDTFTGANFWRGRVTDSQSVVSGADYSLTTIADDGGGWVVDANGIKVPSAGVYFVSWNARFSYNGSAVGDFISSAFRNQSGTQLARNGTSQDNGSNLVTFTLTRTFTVTDAATFRFRIYNDGAPTVTVSSNVALNALDIFRIGQ